MACKRTASNDLNHVNWNDEEEPEEAGTFVKASQDVLEKRVLKAARRRLPRSADGTTKSAFGSFAGFKTTAAPAASPFSFLAKANTAGNPSSTSNPLLNSVVDSNGLTKIPENGTEKSNVTFPSMDFSSDSQETKKVEQSEKKEPNIFKKSSDYYAKLKGLNESVTQWIKSHVDSNPFCILTPIFRDYERYLKDIEANHGGDSSKLLSNSDIPLEPPQASSSKLTSAPSTDNISSENTEKKAEKSMFDGVKSSGIDWSAKKSSFNSPTSGRTTLFGSNTAEKTENKTIFGGGNTENNPFLSKTSSVSQNQEETDKTKSEQSSSGYMSFSQSNSTSATFSFGQSSSAGATPSAGFSFGSAKPFSFGSHVAAPAASETKADNEEKEDEDVPPKPDFKPITEEDAFFEKRCKVFVKKDGNFSDRGIGVLFLKSTPNGKTQLIVRADNSLGNLLLNTLLTTSIPTKRMNKNTVMLVCLPLPDSEPPPTPVLLRVKTSDDADNLIETLDSNKK